MGARRKPILHIAIRKCIVQPFPLQFTFDTLKNKQDTENWKLQFPPYKRIWASEWFISIAKIISVCEHEKVYHFIDDTTLYLQFAY